MSAPHSPELIEQIRQMAAIGMSQTAVSKAIGRHHSTVCHIAKANGIAFKLGWKRGADGQWHPPCEPKVRMRAIAAPKQSTNDTGLIFGRARFSGLEHLARVNGWSLARARQELAVERARIAKVSA